MENTHNHCWGEAAAETSTDPDEAAEEDQSQRHQGQEELAPPQICTNTKHSITEKKSRQESQSNAFCKMLCNFQLQIKV